MISLVLESFCIYFESFSRQKEHEPENIKFASISVSGVEITFRASLTPPQNKMKNTIINKQKMYYSKYRVMLFCMFMTPFFTSFYSKFCNGKSLRSMESLVMPRFPTPNQEQKRKRWESLGIATETRFLKSDVWKRRGNVRFWFGSGWLLVGNVTCNFHGRWFIKQTKKTDFIS